MPQVAGVHGGTAAPRLDLPAAATAWRLPLVSTAIVGAWLVAIVAQLTGNAAALHHHALIEKGPALWVGVPLFLLGWQVMVVAMMLPASLPTIRMAWRGMGGAPRPRLAATAFMGGYVLAWTTFGLVAFFGDLGLHHVVDASPWLAGRPWLIEAGVLALAGVYQFAPRKQRSLEACRLPAGLLPEHVPSARGGFRLGLDHGLDCLGSSWALMLLMFAQGFANLWWMAALTALMAYEANGRHGQRAAPVAGAVLLVAGLAVLSGPLPITT